jgi:ketosteroid isomerase-like protein
MLLVDFDRRVPHHSTMSEQDEAIAANAAYYRAFSGADFAAMTQIWAEDDISCVHPGWPILIGRQAVIESWRNIMRGPGPERIECRDVTAVLSGEVACVLCVEIVGTTPFAASNWFRRVGGTWRMIHHHASPIAMAFEDAIPEPASRRLN